MPGHYASSVPGSGLDAPLRCSQLSCHWTIQAGQGIDRACGGAADSLRLIISSSAEPFVHTLVLSDLHAAVQSCVGIIERALVLNCTQGYIDR